MIIYFADRLMRVLGLATTNLRKGYVITEDLKTEDVETGVATFTCRIGFDKTNRTALEAMTNAGNYLLRSNDGENEFYTIIESEVDTENQEIYVYAEDAGLDLLNEIAGAFEADDSHNAEWYINKYIIDSGFEIGINEIPSDTVRKLKWEGEETVTARLASIATQFGGYEIAFSFDIDGLEITNKKVNIYAERGKDLGVQLRLNKEIDRIITTKSVANLATAFVCEGSSGDDGGEPITLKGYTYDDGDFYVDDNGTLKSRKAVEKWSRYVWNKEPNQLAGYEGHIVRPYSYETTDQKTLCSHAITELKKVCDMEINLEIDVHRFPDGVKIGDRVTVIDDDGGLYVSTRILLLESSVVDDEYTATLGDHIIKKSGISQKVADLAAQFAKNAQSAAKALAVANSVNAKAEEAKTQANAAKAEATSALTVANEAKSAVNTATATAQEAKTKAEATQAAIDKVEASVTSIETTVTEAKTAAENANKAVAEATTKAGEAKTAASNAQAKAEEAKTTSGVAKTSAESAKINAAEAKVIAENSKTNAQEAIATAEAAKADAEQAKKDVVAFGENLETVTDTMRAEYARKTELTETEAHLQSQISKNAAGVSSTVSLLMTIDETANNAREKANVAQAEAQAAQTKANEATANAEAARLAANQAAQAASEAQNEADLAQSRAEEARNILAQANEDLEAAMIDLATVEARADATEEEIAAAHATVATAQGAVDIAKANATTAIEQATEAKNQATTAAANAWKAQETAQEAQANADIAQQLADELAGNATTADEEATEAESKASQAKTTAGEAQAMADTARDIADEAVATAETAQATANEAVANAEAAQATADEAAENLEQANATLAYLEARLSELRADASATQEEINNAQSEVDSCYFGVVQPAEQAATEAQANAEIAKANAETAQAAANEASVAARNAQEAALEAQDLADEAKTAVDGLAVRVTKAETNIKQGQREITLRVTNVEEETTANGTKITKAEAIIQQLADAISLLVTDEHGTTLLEQTSTGWTFNLGDVQKNVESATEQLGDLTKELGSTQAAVDVLEGTVKDLGVLAEYIKIGTYTYIDENGNEQTEPSIDLGENDTGFKLKITNTRIWFTDGSTDLVEINSKDKSLDIEKAKIKSELQMGGFVWKVRSNGNLGLTWKGVIE